MIHRLVLTCVEQIVAEFPSSNDDYSDWCPAYDLGYLLRKLKQGLKYGLDDIGIDLALDQWEARHKALGTPTICEACTPEDAAAKLAVELFKQGILTK